MTVVLDAQGRDPVHKFHVDALTHWLKQHAVALALRKVGKLPKVKVLDRLLAGKLPPTETAQLMCEVLACKPVRKVIAQVISTQAKRVPISYRAALAQLYDLYRELRPAAQAGRAGLVVAAEGPQDVRRVADGAISAISAAAGDLDLTRAAARAQTPAHGEVRVVTPDGGGQ